VRAPQGFRGPFRTDVPARALYAEGAGIFRIIPAAVAVPADRDDLVALVRWAGETATALVPRGAGSGMPGGNVGPGVVVDLTRGFRSPPVIDAEAGTARAGASITYRELNDAAAAHGLRLPPDPSSGNFCTIGGMVATNAAGARTVKYGAMRSWVRSVEFVSAEGEVGVAGTRAPGHRGTEVERRLEAGVAPWLRQHQLTLENAGPKTRKNSAGYLLANYPDDDWVKHLLIGSEGTLAFITDVEVSLAPLPASLSTLLVTLRSLDDVAPAVRALAPLAPSALELLDKTYLDFARATGSRVPSGTEALLLVEFEGDAREGERTVQGIAATTVVADDPAAVARLWELRHLASPILAGLPDHMRSLQVVEDGCVPLDRLGEYITALRRGADECGFQIVIFGHAGDGHVHANVLANTSDADLAERLERCLGEVSATQIALGGTTAGEHGDGRLRAPFVESLYGAAYMEGCRRVKAAFDPQGILNPGVKLTVHGSRLTAGMLKVGAGAPAIPDAIARTLRSIEKEARWGVDRLRLLQTTAD
jgi:FAD/FMN-containing dehydrogenase